MNPGLVVKLRPTGPWRVGSDSGARNRVDSIYHSDSLYAAVASAMARLDMLPEWLDATARAASPAVRFSSCFPFIDAVDFIVPPRTLWPPTHPGISPRVRWKSARFVPVSLLQSLFSGLKLDDNRWSVDALSECLVPAGRTGPFRTGVRSNAAVDRLTGVAERHSIACTEFRKGAGLWAIVSFADEAARDRWQDPIKAAFRWLADSGFGGERSRGWGRSEAPEFAEGVLPEMVIGSAEGGQGLGAGGQGMEAKYPEPAPPAEKEPPTEPEPAPPVEEPQAEPPIEEPPAGPPETEEGEASVEAPSEIAPLALAPEPELNPEGQEEPPAPPAAEAEEVEQALAGQEPAPEPEAQVAESAPPEPEPAPGPQPPAPAGYPRHWLLSLFTPAESDSVDWTRGNYAVVTRSGRIESPAGGGELKKQLTMVTEGSVICATAPPQGAAPDVAPEGFAHPVYRAGFALAILLPEGR